MDVERAALAPSVRHHPGSVDQCPRGRSACDRPGRGSAGTTDLPRPQLPRGALAGRGGRTRAAAAGRAAGPRARHPRGGRTPDRRPHGGTAHGGPSDSPPSGHGSSSSSAASRARSSGTARSGTRCRRTRPLLLDPVGAGDAFAAGLLADLAAGRSLVQALGTAAAVAAIDVSCPGDWEGLPTRAELDLLRRADVVR